MSADVSFDLNPQDKISSPIVLCFTHAGGNPENYLNWQKISSSSLRFKNFCLPGTGRRFTESYPTGIKELANQVAAEIDSFDLENYYLFGHSMGAVLAFEVALRVIKPAKGLIVSASAAPANIPSERVMKMTKMTDKEFSKEIVFFNGLDEKIVAGNDFISAFLKRIRKDFDLISRYNYQENKLLSMPLFTIVGDADPHVSPDAMEQWKSVTSGEFKSYIVQGDHFYFNEDASLLSDVIHKCLEESGAFIENNKKILII